jgi:hypothetical protein
MSMPLSLQTTLVPIGTKGDLSDLAEFYLAFVSPLSQYSVFVLGEDGMSL